jgi:ketosteroid isomerase-like protein
LSEANVELMRAAYATPYGGEAWLSLVDEFVAADCEIEDRTLPGVAVGLRGPAAARAEAAHMLDAFEEVDYAAEEFRDLGDEVLVRVRGSGRGRGSGLRIEGTLGHLWTLRAGKVVRLDVYGTWQEALDAAGAGV